MSKKIALVTGANKGIGYEIARQLGKLGMTILVAARSKSKGMGATQGLIASGIDAHPVILDVTHGPSIIRTAEYIGKEYGRLDVLVNNAGIAEDQHHTPSTTPTDILHSVFETNFFGAVAVTQGLLPLLRKSEAGRIVNVSSSLGSIALHADPAGPFAQMRFLAYNTSKTALNSFTVQLAAELRDTPIKVNAACPGWVKTDMGGPDAPRSVEEGADTPIWLATLPADGPTGGFFNSRQPVPW
ncbi:MAG TPA: SDR family oxidoreductase [Chthoniobacteraceae bacterium]|jgi:NAD(P)-dependent dehydrogenase (short-subunit alcohol dehydrogenase family)